MITFKVGYKRGTGLETLFSAKPSFPYMPAIGDSLVSSTGHVGTIEKRILKYDEDGDLEVTFMIDLDRTAEERMGVWTKLGKS